MAKKDPYSFNFGFNKPKKAKKTRSKKGGGKKAKRKSTGGVRSNAWRAYVGGGLSNAPIPP